jgi:hypothetical protein
MTGVPADRSIRTPADLASLIREIRAAVAAGILEQVRPDSSPFATDAEIADLAEQGPWPDYIEMRFRVRGTATRYKLSAETYHGAGGTWAPE